MFDNKAATLFPNQFVNAQLTRGHAEAEGDRAARRDPPRRAGHVRLCRAGDSTVQVRAVTVGVTLPDAVSIDSGLNAGERVVTDGLDDLRDGSQRAGHRVRHHARRIAIAIR